MRFRLELEAVGGQWEAPPLVRLRKLIKAAGRRFGLRVVAVAEVPELGDFFAGAALATARPLPSVAVPAEASRRLPAASEFKCPTEAL